MSQGTKGESKDATKNGATEGKPSHWGWFAFVDQLFDLMPWEWCCHREVIDVSFLERINAFNQTIKVCKYALD